MIYAVAALIVCASAFLVRRARLPWRLCFGVTALVTLSLMLDWQSASPVLDHAPPGPGRHFLLIQFTAAIWWFVAAQLLAVLVAGVLGHDERSREARLFSDLLGAMIYLLAALCVLDFVLDLPVKGLLATSGVVAVVIGLALQNTLSDVFSGIAVGVEAPFSVGNRIAMAGEVEGTVVQINWRSIRVRTDSDDVAIIPNSQVARANIINRSVPTERRTARVQIQRPVSTPPRSVIEALEVAALLTSSLLPDPPPVASLVRLGIQRNMFALDFSVASPRDLRAAKSDLLLAIHRQLQATATLVEHAPGEPPESGRGRILRRTGLFDSLSDVQVGALAASLDRITLEKGERLFCQGELDPSLYIVGNGVLELSLLDGAGRDRSIGRLGPGEFVGEICLLTGVAHPASATAIVGSRVYRLSHEAVEPLLKTHPEILPALEAALRVALEQIDRGFASEIAVRAAGSEPLLGRIYGFFHHAIEVREPPRG